VEDSQRRVLVALLVLTPLIGGCASVRPISEGDAYPAAAPTGQTLDIQVFREGTQIRFTNTTARAFAPSRMWINRWYSRRLEELAPGESVRLPLAEFRDQYGEAFRAGGFFAIQRSDKVAVAELHTSTPEGDAVLPLVVVGGGEE
jgi:hypothetical protein